MIYETKRIPSTIMSTLNIFNNHKKGMQSDVFSDPGRWNWAYTAVKSGKPCF